MKRQPPLIAPPRYPAAGTVVRMPGASATSIFVPAAPTLPAPKTPSAQPLVSSENHAAFQEMPDEKLFPARPKRAAQISICPNVETWLDRYVGTATASRRIPVTLRPP